MSRIVYPATGAVLAVALIAIITFAQSPAAEKKVIITSSSDAEFEQLIPGVTRHVVWGDPDRGAHGAFIRFAPDYTAPTHTHAHEVRIVVLEGAYVYIADGEEKRVEAGDFLLLPAGHPHGTATDPEHGALFYTEVSGPFDLTPVEQD